MSRNEFRLRDWDKTETIYEFVGWRSDRNAFFLLSKPNQRMCLEPVLPLLSGVRFRDGHYPYPESAPVTLQPACLILPACASSPEETETLTREFLALAGFGAKSLGAAKSAQRLLDEYGWSEVLYPQPEDDVPLARYLGWFKAAARRRYQQQLERLAKLTKAEYARIESRVARAAEITDEELASYVAQERARLEDIYTGRPRKIAFGKYSAGGCLNWTLQTVKQQNAGNIRDRYLKRRWAQKHGFDLKKIEQDRERFEEYLCEHTVRMRVEPGDPDSISAGESTLPPLTAVDLKNICKRVRYCLVFADGSSVWLEGYKLRDLISAEEQDEFYACLKNHSVQELVAETARKAARQIKGTCGQLAAITKSLGENIAPLTKLYANPELAEVRKRAAGKGVPELFVDWALSRFMGSDQNRLPTKTEAYVYCGPNTPLGKKLQAARHGSSKQTFARWLGIIRRLLEEKGFLAPPVRGRARKRTSYVDPSSASFEDLNQPTAADLAVEADDLEPD